MLNKICYLIFGLFFCVSFNAEAQWIPTGGPLGCTANQFAKSNGGKLWVCTDNGLYYSLNDGSTWNPINKKIDFCTQVLAFGDTVLAVYHVFNKANAVIASDYFDVKCITSIDNGTTWSMPYQIAYAGITMANYTLKKSSLSYVLSSESAGLNCYESNDFGQTWALATQAVSNSEIYKIMYNKLTAYHQEFRMNFPSPTIIYNSVSFDSKNTWAYLDSSGNNNLKAIGAIDNAIIFLADTLNPKLLRSTNLGSTFDTVLISNASFPVYANIFNVEDTLYVQFGNNINNQTQTFKSIDKGIIWNIMPIQFPYLYSSSFVRNTSGDYLYRSLNGVGILKYNILNDTTTSFMNSIKSQITWNLSSSGEDLYTYNNIDVFRSSDNGDTWVNTTNRYYGMSVSDIKSKNDTVVCITFDSVFVSFNKGNNWTGNLLQTSANKIFLVNSVLIAYDNNNIPFQSSDWGVNWIQSPFSVTVPTWTHYSIQDENNVMYDMVIDTNSISMLFQFNPTLLQFDFVGNTNIVNLTYPSEIAKCGTKWFTYGADGGSSLPLVHSNDGLNWNAPNTANLPINLMLQPYFGKQVFANGIYYSYCNDTTMLSSFDGMTWTPMSSNNSLYFQRFWDSYSHHNMINHKGVLYIPSYTSSIWKRNDTIRNFTGNVYFDINNNSIKDAGETNLQNILVATPNAFSNTNNMGNYDLLTDQNGDSLKVTLPNNTFTSNPSFLITDKSQLSNNNFGLYAPNNISDFKIDVTNTAAFRPGFSTNVIMNITNTATMNQASIVTLHIDTNVQFVSSTPVATSINGNLYTWNLPSLAFTQQQNIYLAVTTKLNATLGDSIRFIANVSPANTDINPLNNMDTLQDIIVGSYDPNDKTCNQGIDYTLAQLNNKEAFEYVIRFQNTGNFPASYVRVEDTLSNMFDWSTFEVLNTSHTMHYTLEGQGVVKFYFDPISLPGQLQNEPESHGFVKYSIKPKQNLTVGNVLKNTAYIYFDFNAPIITNTTLTEIVYKSIVLSSETISNPKEAENALVIYPNPAYDYFTVDLSNIKSEIGMKLLLYSINGELKGTFALNEKINKLPISEYSNGLYIGIVKNAKGQTISNFKITMKK